MKSLLWGLAGATFIVAGLYWISKKNSGKRTHYTELAAEYVISIGDTLQPHDGETISIIKRRLKASGVDHSVISHDSGRFVIKAQKLFDSSLVKQIITARGILSFRETYVLDELLPSIEKANALLARRYASRLPDEPADTVNLPVPDPLDSLDFFKNPLLALLNIPEEEVVPSGYARRYASVALKDTPALGAFLRADSVLSLFPKDASFILDETWPGNFSLVATRKPAGNRSSPDDRNLKKTIIEPADSTMALTLQFNKSGALAIEELTRNNAGRTLAMVIDDHLIAAPTVIGPISGGSITLTYLPNEDVQFAHAVLSGGRIPGKIKIISEKITAYEAEYPLPPPRTPYLILMVCGVITFALIFPTCLILIPPKKNY